MSRAVNRLGTEEGRGLVREAYKKLRQGDAMTNREVDALVDHFALVVEALSPLGDMFALARNEAIHKYNQVHGYQTARARDG